MLQERLREMLSERNAVHVVERAPKSIRKSMRKVSRTTASGFAALLQVLRNLCVTHKEIAFKMLASFMKILAVCKNNLT